MFREVQYGGVWYSVILFHSAVQYNAINQDKVQYSSGHVLSNLICSVCSKTRRAYGAYESIVSNQQNRRIMKNNEYNIVDSKENSSMLSFLFSSFTHLNTISIIRIIGIILFSLLSSHHCWILITPIQSSSYPIQFYPILSYLPLSHIFSFYFIQSSSYPIPQMLLVLKGSIDYTNCWYRLLSLLLYNARHRDFNSHYLNAS